MTRGDKGKLFIRFVPLFTLSLSCSARLCAPCGATSQVYRKSISPLIKKGQLQSNSMEYCYLSLNLPNGELAYCWIPHP